MPHRIKIIVLTIICSSLVFCLEKFGVETANGLAPANYCHLVKTSDQTKHLVYLDQHQGENKIFYRYQKLIDKNWREAKLLLEDQKDIRHLQIIKSSQDNLYIIFESNGVIYYTLSNDQGKTWQQPFKISGKLQGCSHPYALVDSQDSINVIWEQNGAIFYRNFNDRTSKWSIIFTLSEKTINNKNPKLVVNNQILTAVWLSNNLIYTKKFNSTAQQWSSSEKIELTQSYEDLAVVGGRNHHLHIVAVNTQGIYHIAYQNNQWQPEKYLTDFQQTSLANFSLAVDYNGDIYLAMIHQNTLRIFKLQTNEWENIKSYYAENGEILFTPSFAGENSYSKLLQKQFGYDLLFVGKKQNTKNIYLLSATVSQNTGLQLGHNQITKAQIDEDKLAIYWNPANEQQAYQLLISRTDKLQDNDIIYNSETINSPLGTAFIEATILESEANQVYLFLKTKNNDNWSKWSSAYSFYRNSFDNNNGPELDILEIAEDSPQLTFNGKDILYCGKNLTSPVPIIIRGKVKDRGSEIQKLTFSTAFGTTPPPIYNFYSPYWTVRYSVLASEQPQKITITAYDSQNQLTSKTIRIIKDTESPLPPSWVIANNNLQEQNKHQLIHNSKKVPIYWQQSEDRLSGVRYYLVGNSKNWWQNHPHNSGDLIEFNEGTNTVYVFAIDNVGNVSEACTNQVIIDSINPPTPVISSTVTSVNYFTGTVSKDVVSVLINNSPLGVSLNNQVWKYFHDLRDGERTMISCTAVDQAGNKSIPLETMIALDTTAPQIIEVEHNAANTLLRIKDVLIVQIKGEKNQQAYFQLESIQGTFPANDNGEGGDLKTGDGIYTGKLVIEDYQAKENVRVIGYLKDRAGNISQKFADQIINFNSNNPIYIDNFENIGDVYPWKNHLTAENIEVDGDKLSAKEGSAVLKVNYNLRNNQHWAALSSSKFIPKNLYGNSPYINFWVKGKSNARGFIYFEGEKHYSISASLKSIPSKYTFSLNTNNQWKLYSLPVRPQDLENMAKTSRYYLYIFSEDSSAEGTVYLDNLFVSYTPINYPKVNNFIKQPTKLSADQGNNSWTTKHPTLITQNTDFINSSQIQLSFQPQSTFIKGKIYTANVYLPKKIKNIVGIIQNGSQKINLNFQKSNYGYRASFKINRDFPKGYCFATIYAQTIDGQLLRKKQPVQIIDQDYSLIDLIDVTFSQHPLIENTLTKIKLNIPGKLKAQSVVIFMSKENQAIQAIKMIKTGSYQDSEQWYGDIRLPQSILSGDYKAIIYFKTALGKVHQKEFVYSVAK